MNGARRPRFRATQRDHIGSVDSYALKIPARGAEYSLAENVIFQFRAEPAQSDAALGALVILITVTACVVPFGISTYRVFIKHQETMEAFLLKVSPDEYIPWFSYHRWFLDSHFVAKGGDPRIAAAWRRHRARMWALLAIWGFLSGVLLISYSRFPR